LNSTELLGYLTGLRFVAPQPLDLPALLATTLVVHTCDAIMCRLFARNNNYPMLPWTVLGFTLGVWAVVVLILLPKRERARA
jgi:hypothetical protein